MRCPLPGSTCMHVREGGKRLSSIAEKDFSFEEADDALGQSIVIGITDGSDRKINLGFRCPAGHCEAMSREGARRSVYLIDRYCDPVAPLSHMLRMCCRATGNGLPSNRERGGPNGGPKPCYLELFFARLPAPAHPLPPSHACKHALSGNGQAIAKQSAERGAQTVSSWMSRCAMLLPERDLPGKSRRATIRLAKTSITKAT